MIDNDFIFWTCYVTGWILVTFSAIGGIWLIIRMLILTPEWLKKYKGWKDRAIKAEKELRDAEQWRNK